MAKNMTLDIVLDLDDVLTITATAVLDGEDAGDLEAAQELVRLASKAGFTIYSQDGVNAPIGPWASGSEAKKLVEDELIGS